ncbi:MAG: hypothetical protein IT354_11305 [Gemmatimonadaceae bacterium]|jgi:pyocin large subunit-like protein|nr:hypothetical protein [Gemmatimonadaceae bacterium]
MRRIIGLIGVVVALWLFLQRAQDSTTPAPGTGPAPTALPNAAPPAGAVESRLPGTSGTARRVSVGFRSPTRLAEHYAKHGAEFGRVSEAEYLSLAQALRDAAVGDNVLEVVRSSDGVISRFDRTSGAFLAADADGTIRTFFKPNDGEAYFKRQARRRPSP